MAEWLCCDKVEMQLQALCEIPQLAPLLPSAVVGPLEIRGLERNYSSSPLPNDVSRQRKLGHVVPSGELLIGGYVVSLVWAEIVRAPYCGNLSREKERLSYWKNIVVWGNQRVQICDLSAGGWNHCQDTNVGMLQTRVS